MSTNNICFSGKIRKILCGYPFLSVAMLNSLGKYIGGIIYHASFPSEWHI